jgi:hypothetical protein
LSKYIAKYQPEKRRDVAQIVAEKRGRKSFLSEESEDVLRLAIQSLDLCDFLITTYTLKEFIVKLKARDLGIERWTEENRENVKKPCKVTT